MSFNSFRLTLSSVGGDLLCFGHDFFLLIIIHISGEKGNGFSGGRMRGATQNHRSEIHDGRATAVHWSPPAAEFVRPLCLAVLAAVATSQVPSTVRLKSILSRILLRLCIFQGNIYFFTPGYQYGM